MKLFTAVSFLVLVALALITAYDTVVIAVRILVVGATAVLLGGGVVILGVWTWRSIERIRTERAQRLKIQQEAGFLHAPINHRAWLRMADGQVLNLSMQAAMMITDGDRLALPSPDEVRQWREFYLLQRNPRIVGGTTPLLEAQPRPEPILDALGRTQRGLIVGVQDAGKSTLLRYLADDARQAGHVVVIDPHTYQGKWPATCNVVGGGRDFNQIDQALSALLGMMNARYQRMAAGHSDRCTETPVTVIIDEWLAVAQSCPNAKGTIITLLSESRKASMRVYVGCHSESVKSLGLDGQGDLRDGFEIYHLEISQQTGERQAYLEVKRRGQPRQITPLALPGPYNGNGHGMVIEGLPQFPELSAPPATPGLNGNEKRILEMHRAGASLRQIAREALGVQQPGTPTFDKIRDIIARNRGE